MKLIILIISLSAIFSLNLKEQQIIEYSYSWPVSYYVPTYTPSIYSLGYYYFTPYTYWTFLWRTDPSSSKTSNNEKALSEDQVNKEISTLKQDLFKNENMDLSEVRKEKKALSLEFIMKEMKLTRLLQLEDSLKQEQTKEGSK